VNTTLAWTVTAAGVTANAASGQTTLTVGVWDAAIVGWTIQAGGKSYQDSLRIQRPDGPADFGVGGFTIPILPVTIVYAPPIDSLNKSAASYLQGNTVGTTVTTSLQTDSSNTTPDGQAEYSGLGDFVDGLNTVSQFLSLLPTAAGAGAGYAAGSKIFSAISSELGKFSANITTGFTDLSETQMTVSQTTTDSMTTLPGAGGPGVGDLFHCYKDVRVAWYLLNGQFKLLPLGFVDLFFPIGSLETNIASLGISAADAQLLSALDPFVAGGPQADLPADRYSWLETWEYAFGAVLSNQIPATRDTKDTTTTKSYTTTTTEWDPGPIFQLLGFGGKTSTTVTLSNATGNDVSSTVVANASLVAGPQDHFVVSIYYDSLFGTFAFQQNPLSPLPRLQGTNATAGEQVTLTSGGKTFRAVADQDAKFAFWMPTLPAGPAMLAMANQPPSQVMVPSM